MTANPSPLVDAEARARIANDLDSTLVVEAAAGTGKTTALVERILSLLRTGKATLRTLVAVTFTEKAAGEMKLRLRTEIEKARTKAAGPAEQEHLNLALRQLEAAHIGTIHAFCADMLRERPVEAKVDPLFEVASEDESERLYDEAFTRWFQETLQSPSEGVSRVLRRATRERDQDGPRAALRKAGRNLIEQRDFPTPYARPDFDRKAALDAVIERLRALRPYPDKATYQDNWLVKSLQEIGRVVSEIERREEMAGGVRDHDAVEAQLRQLVRYKGWGYTGGRTQWFNRNEGITMQQVRDERAAAKTELDRVLDSADADLSALLFRELWGVDANGTSDPAKKGVIRFYDELKARAGKLDFLDLLVLTRDLLRSDESVRIGLQRRFTHLLVDEFQDTDPLQAEMLLLLASDDPKESDPERVKVAPGKLFLVGDPKQSIYRFRRAEVSLYETIKARLLSQSPGAASLVHLQTSFRSAPSIQAFVNSAFEPLMKTNARKSQADYVALAPSRPDPVGRPTVIALPVPRPYSDFGNAAKVTNWKIEESLPDAVGAFVDWLVNESGWTITERGSSEPVKVGTRHVCLLFKRLQSFGNDVTRPYVRALEVRRLPHVLVGGKSFHDREEVIALRSALAAIEWPDDGMSIYAALRGPFFALSDDALIAFRHTQRHLHPLRKRDEEKLTELTRPVGVALDVLARLHVGRNRRSIADTIAQFLEATRAHAGVAIWPAGEQALGNILRVLDMARRFEQGSVTSFRAFVGRLEEDAERGGVNEAPVVEEGTDGVRIMTVHKAKGLEFPVVILVDPTANMTFREPSRYVDPSRKLWAVPLCGASPQELLDRRDEILDQDREEAIRLLYVATTRARELLVVPVIGDERDDKQAPPPPANGAAAPRPASEGWLDALDPVVYPSDRRGAKAAPGCPLFGDDTVLERPQSATRSTGSSVRPGLHKPAVGTHSIVFWDPSAIGLDKEDDAGQRQQKILAIDDKGIVAKEGIEQHAAWRRDHDAAIANGSTPTRVVRTVTDEKEGVEGQTATKAVPADVTFEATATARHTRPHGKRFGILVHAMLASVPLDGDAGTIADTSRIQARILGASDEEAAAARDVVAAALAHPLLARARKAVRVERETAVMLRAEDGAIVEGIVDLAFLEQGPAGPIWTVIDFKTDVEMAGRKDDYARQIDAYARAIAAATGEPAKGALLAV
ncbi:MAG: ATP-dependent helicase/nuclease subunit [Myxococcales bacterium]|nr:ATP-dependent helicase/nuclease subunit [Myxococcales bacterium]